MASYVEAEEEDRSSGEEEENLNLEDDEFDEDSGEAHQLQLALEQDYPGTVKTPWTIALGVVIIALVFIPFVVGFFGNHLLPLMFTVLAFPPPVVILYFIFWRRDRTQATYSGVAKFFIVGVIGVIPVMIVELIFSVPFFSTLTELLNDTNSTTGISKVSSTFNFNASASLNDVGGVKYIGTSIYFSFVVAALVEESFKFFTSTLFCYCTHTPTIAKPYTVTIIMASAAIGFATIENYFNIITQVVKNSGVGSILLVAFLRAILSLPIHSFTGVLIGGAWAKYYNAQARDSLPLFYAKTMWLPLLLHGFFDFFAFLGSIGGYWMIIYIFNIGICVVGGYFAMKTIQEIRVLQAYEYSAKFQRLEQNL